MTITVYLVVNLSWSDFLVDSVWKTKDRAEWRLSCVLAAQDYKDGEWEIWEKELLS